MSAKRHNNKIENSGALFWSKTTQENIKHIRMSGISIIAGAVEIGAIGMMTTIAPSKRNNKPLVKITLML